MPARVPVKLNSTRFRSATVNGLRWSDAAPGRLVDKPLAERLVRLPYFEDPPKPQAGGRGKALIFMRGAQAPAFWELAKGLARCGLTPVFCEIHRRQKNDNFNLHFLMERRALMLPLAAKEPDQLPMAARIRGYDLEAITRFARWRWSQRDVDADGYLMARTAWLIPRLEEIINAMRPILVCTWGNMCHDSRAAIEVARRGGIEVLMAEGGFFPETLTVDSRDMYFTSRSEFEDLWRQTQHLSEDEQRKLTEFLAHWKASGLSKYNRPTRFQRRYRDIELKDRARDKKLLLVACQTTGDATMYYPDALIRTKEELTALACSAMRGLDDWTVIIKPHPHEGASEEMRRAAAASPNALIIEDAGAQSAVKAADAVLTINSTLGLEALCHGKKVVTLGDNIYTRRGLTTDLRTEAEPDAVRDAVLSAREPEPEDLQRFLRAVIFRYLYHYDLPTGRPEAIVAKAADKHRR